MEYSIDWVFYGPTAQNGCKSFSFLVMKMGCVKEAPLYVYLTISITNHNHLLFTTIRLVRSPIV